MTDTRQLEMKIHKLAERIGKLEALLKELKDEYTTRKEGLHD